MRDCIVPGGVAVNLKKEGEARLRALIATIARQFPELVAIYDDTPSLQDRMVTTGIVKPELARRFAPGGYVGPRFWPRLSMRAAILAYRAL